MDTDNIQLTTEQASCFAQPAEVPYWIFVIENRIGPWIKDKGNKALWDIVLFASQRQGIVKKPLSRLKFAELLVALCPKALEASDTASSIKASMEKSADVQRLQVAVNVELVLRLSRYPKHALAMGSSRLPLTDDR